MSMVTQNECIAREIARSHDQWDGQTFYTFDDGDLVDSISLSTLECHRECRSGDPEWSTAFGGSYQSEGMIDYVCLSLLKGCKGLSFVIANDLEGIRPSEELGERFHWCLSWNTKTSETIVHYVEEGLDINSLSSLTWEQVRDWLVENQFQLYHHEYRKEVVPSMAQS